MRVEADADARCEAAENLPDASTDTVVEHHHRGTNATSRPGSHELLSHAVNRPVRRNLSYRPHIPAGAGSHARTAQIVAVTVVIALVRHPSVTAQPRIRLVPLHTSTRCTADSAGVRCRGPSTRASPSCPEPQANRARTSRGRVLLDSMGRGSG